MLKKIFHFISSQKTLEDKLFWMILSTLAAASIFSAVVTLVENLNLAATLLSAVPAVGSIILLLIAHRFGHYKHCYFWLTILFSTASLPILYFVCGGVYSGIPLYFLCAIYICSFILEGWRQAVAIIVSSASAILTIALSMIYPQWVAPVTPTYTSQDMILTLSITGSTILIIQLNVMKAHNEERRNVEQLLEKVNHLSLIDALTGLFNRRELFRYMIEIVLPAREQYYLAIFDVDNFKNINDTYGHLFGDDVLRRFGEILMNAADSSQQELASRYGGEEFIILVRASNAEQAFQKTDLIREQFSQQKWENHDGLQITVSGGLTPCILPKDISNEDEAMQIVNAADQLLYRAKKEGKNRICVS